MIRKNQKMLNFINGAMDAALVIFAYLLSAWIRLCYMTGYRNAFVLLFQRENLLLAVGYAAAVICLYAMFGMYGSFRYKNVRSESLSLAGLNLLAMGGLAAAMFVLHFYQFSRLMLGLLFVFATVLVVAKRMAVRVLLRHFRAKGMNTRSLVVLGLGDLARRYHDGVMARRYLGYRYLGYVSDREDPALGKRLCGYGDFSAWLAKNPLDEAVMAVDAANLAAVGGVVAACGRYGVKISVIPSYNDFIPSRPTAETLGELKLINVRRAPGGNPAWRAFKRMMDVLGSGLGLVLLSPVLLGAAIAVKCSSPGSAIFCQTRVGLGGKEFHMYKFRSMYRDAEQRLAELQKFNEVDGPVFKMANDPRITPVGKWLRRTSIDELPQLLNILKGDMSIVGPRPPLPGEVAQYSDFEWGRLTVRPGLTCYWQVNGRSNLSFEEWMKLDLKYIEEQSFTTDMKILFKTVGVVLRGDGAY